MFIKIICIVALLEYSLSEYDAEYLPMGKDSKYGDDVCRYTDDKQKYVKPCEKGKFCGSNLIGTLDYIRGKHSDTSEIEICQDLPNITALYNYNEGSCKNDFECRTGYKCIDNKCLYDDCDTGEFLSEYGCKENSKKGDYCYEFTQNKDSYDYKYSPKEPNKECGKLILEDDPRSEEKGIYYLNKREYVYEGEVEDGEYVSHRRFCKSGFALYFYKDGKTEDPRDTTANTASNTLYLRCVTPISVFTDASGQCSINYKINGNEEILRYNTGKLSGLSLYSGDLPDYCSNPDIYIQLRHEKYREFYTKISEEERKTCGKLDTVNQYTCENNELIKLWYIYINPDKYITYNNRKKIGKVLDYFIQKDYPCYSLSQFLSIKFFYLLFLFLF